MATIFNVTVKASGGDYSTWNAAGGGLANDLTLSTIKVFSISSSSATKIAAGSTLLGGTSGATGVCVLVNATKTQILVKTIAVAAFQSGETVTGSDTNTCVLSNAGDSPILLTLMDGIQDTTAVNLTGFTHGASNYSRWRAAAGAEATLPYGGSSYRLELATGTLVTYNTSRHRFEYLQIKYTSPASANAGQCLSGSTSNTATIVLGCYLWGVMHASNGSNCRAIRTNSSDVIHVIDTVIRGFSSVGGGSNAANSDGGNQFVFYNCLAYDCLTGFSTNSSSALAKNCMYDGAGGGGTLNGFSGTWSASSTNNASTVASDCPGSNPHDSATFTYVNTGTGDFHLSTSDAGAKDLGADLSADGTYAVTDDFDRVARSGTWDIGPFNVAGGSALTVSWAESALSLADSRAQASAKNVADTITLAAAIAMLTGKPLTDAIVLASAMTSNPGKVLSESALSLADSITEALGTSAADALSLLDVWVVLLSASYADALSLTDGIANQAGKVLTDTVPIGAAISISLGAGIFLSDAVVLADGRVIALAKPITNALVLGEAWDAQLNGALFTAGWAEAALNLSDARVVALSKAMADALNLLDVWKVRYHPAGGGGSALAADSERRRRFIAS